MRRRMVPPWSTGKALLLRRLLTLLLALLLQLLLHLLRLHLLHHRRAAARDLPHPDLERKIAVLGEARRWRAVHEGQPLRHRKAIFTALLHPAHRLGEARVNAFHHERRGLLAGVDDGAVVGG